MDFNLDKYPRLELLTKQSAKLGMGTGRAALTALAWPAQKLTEEYAIGSMAKLGERHGLWQIAWDDPEHKEFRYHNAALFNDVAAAMWATKEAFVRGHLIGGVTLDPVAIHQIYQDEGHAWAQKNGKLIDSLFELGLDPTWLASPALKVLGEANKLRELVEITKTVSTIREEMEIGAKGEAINAGLKLEYKGLRPLADKALESIGVTGAEKVHVADMAKVHQGLASLWGGPLNQVAADIVTNAPSSEAAAEQLFALQYRSRNAYAGAKAATYDFLHDITPPFFRRAGTFYAEAVSDAALRKAEIKAAVLQNYMWALDKAKTALHGLTAQDVVDVQKILDRVRRPAGLALEEVGPYVERAVHEMVMNAADLSNKMTLKGPMPRGLSAVASLDRTLVHGGIWEGAAPAPDAVRAAGEIASHLKSGWEQGTGYLENYTPQVKEAVEKIVEKFKSTLEPGSPVEAYWRKPRKNAVEFTSNADVLSRGVAQARVREWTKKMVDAFAADLATRESEFKNILSTAENSGVTKRAEQAIEDLGMLRNELETYKSTFGNTPMSEFAKYWNGVMHQVRLLQLAPFGGHGFHLMRDGIFRNFVEAAGDTTIFNRAPSMRRLTGEMLEVESSLSRDMLGHLDKGMIGEWLHQAHELARKQMLSWAYNKEARAAVARGYSNVDADRAALQYAKAMLARVHPAWEHASHFETALRLTHSYPSYYLNAMKFWTGAAARFPSEAIFMAKARQFQKQHLSFDGRGNMRIAGTDKGFDPWRLFTFNSTFRPMIDPEQVLPPKLGPFAQAIKLSEAVMGPILPPLRAAGQAVDSAMPALKRFVRDLREGETDMAMTQMPLAGTAQALDSLAPGKTDPQKNWKQTVDDLGQVFQVNDRRDIQIPEAALPLGTRISPTQHNDDVRNFMVRREIAASKLNGAEKTWTQASKDYDVDQAQAAVIGLATGLHLVPATPGHEQLTKDVRDYTDAPDQATRQIHLMTHPHLDGLVPVYLPADGLKDPDNFLQMMDSIKQNPKAQEQLQQIFTEAPKDQKVSMSSSLPMNLLASIKGALANFHNPFVSEAFATTGDHGFAPDPSLPSDNPDENNIDVQDGKAGGAIFGDNTVAANGLPPLPEATPARAAATLPPPAAAPAPAAPALNKVRLFDVGRPLRTQEFHGHHFTYQDEPPAEAIDAVRRHYPNAPMDKVVELTRIAQNVAVEKLQSDLASLNTRPAVLARLNQDPINQIYLQGAAQLDPHFKDQAGSYLRLMLDPHTRNPPRTIRDNEVANLKVANEMLKSSTNPVAFQRMRGISDPQAMSAAVAAFAGKGNVNPEAWSPDLLAEWKAGTANWNGSAKAFLARANALNPGNAEAMSELQRAYHSPSDRFFNAVVQKIDDGISKGGPGAPSKDFWQQINAGDQVLSDGVAVRTARQKADIYRDSASTLVGNGRTMLNPVMVAARLATDHDAVPAYAMIAQGLAGSREDQEILAAARARFPTIAALFESSPQDSADHAKQDFYLQREHPFVARPEGPQPVPVTATGHGLVVPSDDPSRKFTPAAQQPAPDAVDTALPKPASAPSAPRRVRHAAHRAGAHRRAHRAGRTLAARLLGEPGQRDGRRRARARLSRRGPADRRQARWLSLPLGRPVPG
jgi:hypothetical protein